MNPVHLRQVPNCPRAQCSQVTTTPGCTAATSRERSAVEKANVAQSHVCHECDGSVTFPLWKWDGSIHGCLWVIFFPTLLIPTLWARKETKQKKKNFMSCSKILISAIWGYDWPFWSINGPHIHSVGPCEGGAAVTHSGLVTASFYWAIVSLASAAGGGGGGTVREFCSELLGCGSDTSRHRESSVPHLRGRGAGKRWHRGVMKKCLCVRGLKNSPFRVVRLLAEQRQGPVSENCCKDYLVWILYQGTAKQEPPFFFFPLRLDLAVAPVFLERTLPFLLHSSSGPMSSLALFSLPPFIFKSEPSPEKRQLLSFAK